ncbi:DNA (cytosine-5)-methyltransferase 1 [Streptomyces sp. SAI-208]|uniref:DNA cytosine methyltransferase n=1 Tax=Streptomyces sp. SAI-208 TaxID=2940550 RepID=UPI0024763B61|nr:DNA cytosine methyltransferase [Streptomyces sp. SAI-208]MDH6610255.1 DNA (cytosine-5)-methyltransferase 1 [Streptomyces sp. SAI-208]
MTQQPTAIGLCSGAGQLDVAVESVTGVPVAAYAEKDPYAAAVMAARFPGIPNLGDIELIDWRRVRDEYQPADLIAGWPCQGISNNGHRLGLGDPRSGLWRNVAEAVQVLRPARVFLENVAALKRRGFATVSANLNELGYDLYWTITKASDVGAAHSRSRFIGFAVPGAGVTVEVPAPAPLYGPLRLLPTPKATDGPNGGPNQRDGAGNYYLPGLAPRLDDVWFSEELGADFGPAVRRWSEVTGLRVPAPLAPDFRGNARVSAAAYEFLMGWPAGWVTDVPGIPRSQQIKICGNGVVPQQTAAGHRLLMATAGAASRLDQAA